MIGNSRDTYIRGQRYGSGGLNVDTPVAGLFTRVDMPTNPFEIPLQLGKMYKYVVANMVARCLVQHGCKIICVWRQPRRAVVLPGSASLPW